MNGESREGGEEGRRTVGFCFFFAIGGEEVLGRILYAMR